MMINQYILIYLNGKPFNCRKNLLLKDLLDYLDVNISSSVIEYNRQIVQNLLLDRINLCEGDKIEIVSIVGGG